MIGRGGSERVKVLRRLLLAVCLAGLAAGVWLVVGALASPAAPAAKTVASAAMIAVPAASVSVHDFVASAGPVELDALEVSVAAYQACVRAGVCPLHVTAADSNDALESVRGSSTDCVGGGLKQPEEPINCVDFAAAEAYCRWVGKRLPTRDEWWVALAPRHREAFRDVHRARERKGAYWAEWTSTPVTIDGRWSAVPALRHIMLYRVDAAYGDRMGEPYVRATAVADRSSDLGFRCAR